MNTIIFVSLLHSVEFNKVIATFSFHNGIKSSYEGPDNDLVRALPFLFVRCLILRISYCHFSPRWINNLLKLYLNSIFKIESRSLKWLISLQLTPHKVTATGFPLMDKSSQRARKKSLPGVSLEWYGTKKAFITGAERNQ